MILGFDVDDVVADFWSVATPIFNRKYGVESKKEDHISFSSLEDIYGINYSEFFRTVLEEGVLEQMIPYQGVPEIMRNISEAGHSIVLVTSRSYHPDALEVTSTFFKKNDIPYNELYIKEDGKNKSDYLPHGTHFFLDDLPSNLNEIEASGKVQNLGLISQPWNKSERSFDRYRNLSDFYQRQIALHRDREPSFSI